MGAARPADAGQVAEIVRAAAADGSALDLRGGGTKARLGRRPAADAAPAAGAVAVDLTGLAGVVTYEPEELILIARPGTPLAEVEALLADHAQHLAFEPPHWGPAATLGGVLGCGWAGPRRWRAGGVRDWVLGAELVDGRGRIVRAGGRVVKNVTGYDLWRATVGALGTLGVCTEVCLKLWPRPERAGTLALPAGDRDAALARLRSWSRRPEEITGLAWSPAAGGRLWARVEGTAGAVTPQLEALRADAGGGELLDDDASRALWAQLREPPAVAPSAGALWRLVVPPSAAPGVLAGLEALGAEPLRVDWAGGLLWASLPAAMTARVHDAVAAAGGCAARLATGVDDPDEHAFTPLTPGVARLNEALRATLDPHRLFSPGRLYPLP